MCCPARTTWCSSRSWARVRSLATGKRLELLKEIVPGLARVGVLRNPLNPGEHALPHLARNGQYRSVQRGPQTSPKMSRVLTDSERPLYRLHWRLPYLPTWLPVLCI